MLAVNYSTIRNNLKSYCDKATDENETVIVTRKDENKCGDHQLGTIQQHDEGGAQRGISRQNRQEHAAARTRRGKVARIDRG